MRREKVMLGDAKPARPLGKPKKLPANIQRRVYYLNVATEQIAAVKVGERISTKSGFLVCSRQEYMKVQVRGTKPTPVTMQQPVIEQPKPKGIDARRIIADVLGLNRKQNRRLAHVSHA